VVRPIFATDNAVSAAEHREKHSDHEITLLLQQARQGDLTAYDQVLPLVYAELRDIAAKHMRHERESHTLQPTALVHEALLRIVGVNGQFDDRVHFLRTASRAMRHILVDYARARSAARRGNVLMVTFDEALAAPIGDGTDAQDRALDMLALDAALEELAIAEPRCAQVVELRIFAGLDVTEVARLLDVSTPTVKRDWAFARAWLATRLGPMRT